MRRWGTRNRIKRDGVQGMGAQGSGVQELPGMGAAGDGEGSNGDAGAELGVCVHGEVGTVGMEQTVPHKVDMEAEKVAGGTDRRAPSVGNWGCEHRNPEM